MPSILIVDDHPAIRLAMRVLLENEDFDVVGDTDNGQDALRLVKEHNPDIVILDIGIPKLDGLSVTSRIVSQELHTKVIVLTSQSAESFCYRCIQAGAKAFINKEVDLSHLSTAIKAVLAGYTFFPTLELLPADNLPSASQSETHLAKLLSDREMLILQHLATGYSNKSIGEKLFLSNKTVSTYKTRIYQKLGVGSIVELAEFAKRNALVS